VLAFAGIGDPARFFNTLRASGIDVVRERPIADHHVYSETEIESLWAEARRGGLTLVTTEKDLARIQGGDGMLPYVEGLVPFRVTLEFDDATLLRKFVVDRLFKAREIPTPP
jgi:tetraacyldisaccharide 4'-kinase